MKRYLVFAGKVYYPSGGFDDFIVDTDDVDEAQTIAKDGKVSEEGDLMWSQVIDTHDNNTDIAPKVKGYVYSEQR